MARNLPRFAFAPEMFQTEQTEIEIPRGSGLIGAVSPISHSEVTFTNNPPHWPPHHSIITKSEKLLQLEESHVIQYASLAEADSY